MTIEHSIQETSNSVRGRSRILAQSCQCLYEVLPAVVVFTPLLLCLSAHLFPFLGALPRKILDSPKANAKINNNDARSNDEASDKGVGDTFYHPSALAHSSASPELHQLFLPIHRPAQHTTHKRTAKQPAPHTPPANNHGAETKNLTRRCRTSVLDEPPTIVLRNLRSIPSGSARRSRA
ncbi:hypothetical protein Landi51_01732 [Colletotrichum acutatum]